MATCPNCRAEVLWTPCQRCGRPWQAATITETNIPGLFDIRLSDGRELHDMTTRQVDELVHTLGLVPA